MGYWPSKLIAVLNIILMIGYVVISCIIGGQILSAVSGGSMSVVVGIVIIVIITWAIAVFGMTPFHVYERYVLCFVSKSNPTTSHTDSSADGHGYPKPSSSLSSLAPLVRISTQASHQRATAPPSQQTASPSSPCNSQSPYPGPAPAPISSSTTRSVSRNGRSS